MVHTVQKVVTSSEITSQFLDAFIVSPALITLWAALVRSEQRKLTARVAEIEYRCRLFEEAVIRVDSHPASTELEGIDRPPTDIPDCKTSPWAYAIQQSQLGYEDNWYDARRCRAASVTTGSKPDRKRSASRFKPEYPTDVPGMSVSKTVNECFTENVDYQNYYIIKNSSCYDHDVAIELNKMTGKTAAKMKDGTFNGKDPVPIIIFCRTLKPSATLLASTMSGDVAFQTLSKRPSQILDQSASCDTDRKSPSTRRVHDIVFRYRQLLVEAVRHRRRHRRCRR